jgi:protoporphyrinogen oxidase
VRIGILGGGVAGLNTALHFDALNDEGNTKDNKDGIYKIEYQIIEGDSRLGGRLKTVNFDPKFEW